MTTLHIEVPPEIKVYDDLSVVIQAGGESRRMGQSKATVPFLGRPLICRVVKRLTPIAGEMIITTNEPESLSFLHDEYGRDDILLTPDLIDKRGALGGMYTALSVATKPYVAIIACDMIFASAPLVVAQRALLEKCDCVAVVPKFSHGYEPFHSVYRKQASLEWVKYAMDTGETRATGWFPDANLYLLSLDEALAVDPRGGAFINVNTPEELVAMEHRIMNDQMTYASDDLDF